MRTAARRRVESKPYRGGFDCEAKLIWIQCDLVDDVDIVLATFCDETLAFRAEKFRGFEKS